MIQTEIEYHEKILLGFIEEAETCLQYVHSMSTMYPQYVIYIIAG